MMLGCIMRMHSFGRLSNSKPLLYDSACVLIEAGGVQSEKKPWFFDANKSKDSRSNDTKSGARSPTVKAEAAAHGNWWLTAILGFAAILLAIGGESFWFRNK